MAAKTVKPKPVKTTEQKLKETIRNQKLELTDSASNTNYWRKESTKWREKAEGIQLRLNSIEGTRAENNSAEIMSLKREVRRLTDIVRWQINPETADPRIQPETIEQYPGAMYR